MMATKKSFINSRQIKAARALLDWSQEDLAAASNLSIATVRKIESGHISPRGSTMGSIQNALEVVGLEFIEPNGVRQKPDDITVYSGRDGFMSFYDDVYQTARKTPQEIAVVSLSDNIFAQALGEDNVKIHVTRMGAIKEQVRVKCILVESDQMIPDLSYCEYRQISKSYVDSVPFYIYGDKCAIIVFDTNPSPKITVLQSPVVANAFRRQFYSMWDKATPLNVAKKGAQLHQKARRI